MAQTYTLDEAATRLGMPAEEFKRRLRIEWKSITTFRDGPTMRFRVADIDELARSLGQASDPGLQLGAPGSEPQSGSSEEFLLADPPKSGHSHGDDDSAVVQDDIFSLAAGDSGRTKKPKSDSDSDVRLEISSKQAKRDPEGNRPTEEIALDVSGPGSAPAKPKGGSSAKLKAPKSGPNLGGPGSGNKIPGPAPSAGEPASSDSSSEFELSLDADSGSFELQLNDSSEEVALGGEAAENRGGQSGINLAKPADSGVSLEKGKGKGVPVVEDSDDFELSLDPSDPGVSGSKLSAPKSGKKASREEQDKLDSEFELTLDDNSGVTDNLAAELREDEENKGDIFETDFELPAVQEDADSGSEVVAVESADTDLENSDFDLALDEADAPASDESESQVVLLDDEPAQPASGRRAMGAAAVAGAAAGAAAARTRRPAAEDEDDDASAALRGVRRDEDEEAAPARAAAPAKWGWVPLAGLIPCFLLTFIGGIMAYELLRGMWGYNQGTKPGGTIVRGVASLLDMDPKD